MLVQAKSYFKSNTYALMPLDHVSVTASLIVIFESMKGRYMCSLLAIKVTVNDVAS